MHLLPLLVRRINESLVANATDETWRVLEAEVRCIEYKFLLQITNLIKAMKNLEHKMSEIWKQRNHSRVIFHKRKKNPFSVFYIKDVWTHLKTNG